MTASLVDTTDFQLIAEPGEDEAEDIQLLAEMEERARGYLEYLELLPLCQDLLLAYALPGVIALYVARLHPYPTGEPEQTQDFWLIVGDLPSIAFIGYEDHTRVTAIETYCDACQHWAETVLEGGDLSECYPISAAPTQANAENLLRRTAFIRDEILPVVRGKVAE